MGLFEKLYTTKPDSDEARAQKMPLVKEQVMSGLDDQIRKLRAKEIDNGVKRNDYLKKLVDGDISASKLIVDIDLETEMSGKCKALYEALKKELFAETPAK